MNKKHILLMAMGASSLAIGIDTHYYSPPLKMSGSTPKKHWKETQSDEDRKIALEKAQAKRDRKS